ncbi:cell division cycle-associated protein 7-like isoform X2 [Nerophis ophidion]|uniref:cell division cycle-associated protein 7-like isoform X2 n=1 Tax=Nerophis ophidion TaxID=159077 RepID=UPI002ADFA935|nr:cell division cycle-associated protein 7-like isoform X2 [Nerophis ophidion]
MYPLTEELANVFAEDSENDKTFYGFGDEELSDHCNQNADIPGEDESRPSLLCKQTTSKTFQLRVALRSAPSDQNSTDEDGEWLQKTRVKTSQTKEDEGVTSEEDQTRVAEECKDASDFFLAKREQNIRANKAMLAQLMADLQKMPGSAAFLKKSEEKLSKKRPPRSGKESRRNPERSSRRHTRSMGRQEAPQEADVDLSLEEELLQVREALRKRGTQRANPSKPHIIRPVEDITEEQLQLVADNMTDKVYNRVTGSTCHQCRQKTVDTKTCCRHQECRGIQGQFCGPCLRNRYGEDIRKALLDPDWTCPPCRGICNCSFCRLREGQCPTGILFPLAQYHGFTDVHSYLRSLQHKAKSESADVS